MKTYLIVLLALVTITTNAQTKEVYIGARVGRLAIEDYTPRMYGGLDIDVQFENNFGIQYSLLGGKGYFHMPLGAPIGVALGIIISSARNNNDSSRIGFGVLIGVLTAIIPESFSYNIPIHEGLSIAPYVSPLQFEFLKNGVEKGTWYAGGGAGLRLHIYSNDRRVRLTPYVEYKIHYASNIHNGLSFGGCLSFAVTKKK